MCVSYDVQLLSKIYSLFHEDMPNKEFMLYFQFDIWFIILCHAYMMNLYSCIKPLWGVTNVKIFIASQASQVSTYLCIHRHVRLLKSFLCSGQAITLATLDLKIVTIWIVNSFSTYHIRFAQTCNNHKAWLLLVWVT